MNCSSARLELHAYLDAELDAGAALAVEAHLMDCAGCRREFEALQATVETVRGAHGVYDAPESSRERAAGLVAGHQRSAYVRFAAIAAAFAVAIVSFYALRPFFAPRDTMTELAAESHLRYAKGNLPLDIRSNEPSVVAAWLSKRLPFRLTLPNYPEPPGKTKPYVLEGARLLQSGHDDVAYLAYQMANRPISLLITGSSRIAPSGGNIYYSGGLEFHTRMCNGLRVITWSDKGLNYALVSGLATEGAGSCIVCHGTKEDQRKWAPLNPRL
jgi:anti-sigma factor RsiW